MLTRKSTNQVILAFMGLESHEPRRSRFASKPIKPKKRQEKSNSGDMTCIPTDPKKILKRIRSYELKLRKERAQHGFYWDRVGKRHLLAPLYLCMGDLEGALDSYRW